jgi:hypothetical protein
LIGDRASIFAIENVSAQPTQNRPFRARLRVTIASQILHGGGQPLDVSIDDLHPTIAAAFA